VQPGVGQLHLRLDADRAAHLEPGGLGGQGAQQLGLADARLAPHHHDGAVTAAHVGQELPEDLQLIDPAEQRKRRMHRQADRPKWRARRDLAPTLPAPL
jgi:hypothetical protein